MRINFDFTDLEAFLALLETRSFVVAARHLGTSQSALTRRIRRLEEGLGSPLFVRTTRSVRPTLAAKRLQFRAEAMIDEARQTMRELQDQSARFAFQNSAIVTVATVPSAIPRLVIPAAALFATGPGAGRVRILDLLANEVAEAVADGTADFGISSLPAFDDCIVSAPLLDDRVVLTAPRDHPLLREEAVRWDALSNYRIVLPTQGSGNRALIDRALAERALTLLWAYEVPRTSTALELVRAGLGIAPLPLSAVPIGNDSGLGVVELTDPAISRQIGLLTRKNAAMPATAKMLCDAIVAGAGRHRQ